MKYWIIDNGVTTGPFTPDELRARRLSEQTPVWRSGLPDWTYLGNLPEWRELSGETECIEVITDDSGSVRRVTPPGLPDRRTRIPVSPGDHDTITSPAPTYLGWCILVGLACCTVAGIVAFVYALRVRDANSRGFYAQAAKESRIVELWLIISITLGLIALPFNMIFAML